MTDVSGATQDASSTGWVVPLDQIDHTQVGLVGAKAANLAELRRLEGVRVPGGFVVTAEAFSSVVGTDPGVTSLRELPGSPVESHDPLDVSDLRSEVRAAVAQVEVPPRLTRAVEEALARFGPTARFAVRSSASGEDSTTASFAGQFDTFIDVEPEGVVDHVRLCWASLFAEGPVHYRALADRDPGEAVMAVLVQEMVPADAAGVAFTADPVTSDRSVVAIEATPGLGDALVAGRAEADLYAVRGRSIERRVVVTGSRPVLSDEQILRIAGMARHIEGHFGAPQDVEWCVVGDHLYVVQSRPITTLFPIPETDAQGNRVFISVGHQQMMTDPIRPLGISMWQRSAGRPMLEAGSRLFVDATDILASPAVRPGFLAMIERSDRLIGGALRSITERRGYITEPDDPPPVPAVSGTVGSTGPDLPEGDHSLVLDLIDRTKESIEGSARELATLSGPAVFDFIDEDLTELRATLADPLSHRLVMAGMEAAWWINQHIEEWLGDKNAADVLSRSAPGNVTSEMGLGLLDVADELRPHAEVRALLEAGPGPNLLEDLTGVPGGDAARAAIEGWLDVYGGRGIGEIDITRPRWRERPDLLVPLLLGHIVNLEPGERSRRVERGREEALAYENDLLERLRALPDGAEKAAETKKMIRRIHAFSGYREFPKFAMVLRYDLYKEALVAEAERLVKEGVIDQVDDAFFLTFEELRQAVSTRQADHSLISERRRAFGSHARLVPPRVMTSDGEIVVGSYARTDPPSGSLVGLPVSTGTVEGRARVINDLGEAELAPGDILVTTFTDPSWTTVFTSVSGLVTEVGGQMTHGAVIARELGMPAVVGVVDATRLIRDGQRIRVNGSDGVVEVLDQM